MADIVQNPDGFLKYGPLGFSAFILIAGIVALVAGCTTSPERPPMDGWVGTWYCTAPGCQNNHKPAIVEKAVEGQTLLFVNEWGGQATGVYNSKTKVWDLSPWNTTATISGKGAKARIDFGNKTWWTKFPLKPQG